MIGKVNVTVTNNVTGETCRVFHITVPLELGELLDKLAREDGVPVEQYIAGVLESALYDEQPR